MIVWLWASRLVRFIATKYGQFNEYLRLCTGRRPQDLVRTLSRHKALHDYFL